MLKEIPTWGHPSAYSFPRHAQMKTEIFFNALPVRAPEPEEPAPSSHRLGFVSILLALTVVGGVAVSWNKGMAARLQMKSDEELLQDEFSMLQDSREAVFNLRVSSHADYLCFRSPTGEVHRVNISEIGVEGVQKNLFPGRYSQTFEFSPVADLIAVSFLDKSVVLQSLDPSLSEQVLLEKTPEVIESLAYSPDGRLLAGSSSRGLAFVWDVESGKRVTVIRRANDRVSSLVFDSGQGLLVSFESGIERWLIDPNQESNDRRQLVWKLPQHDTAREMVVSPDGQYLVTASFFGILEVWDLSRQEKLWQQDEETHTIRGLMVSRDMKSLFCFSGQKAFIEFDLLTGEKRTMYDDDEAGSGTGAGISRGGDLIYSGWTDGFIRIWSSQEKVMFGKIDTATL